MITINNINIPIFLLIMSIRLMSFIYIYIIVKPWTYKKMDGGLQRRF